MSNQGEVFTGGATTSQHVDAEDDDHFQNTTFKLKRTRSLGLLDEFIDPSEQEKNLENKNQKKEDLAVDTAKAKEYTAAPTSPTSPLSAPATTPTPPFLTSPELIPHDDTDVTVEPSRHVDYLSHQWDVSDICKSWRYVISRRKSVANAARLENASWRTWAQKRCNLKTISPEAVNWSKESDVTWLYGPILDDDDHDHNGNDESRPASTTATNAVAGDVAIARRSPGPKPILKKRTVEDMMISHLNMRKLEIASARAEQEQNRREEAEHQARRDAAAKAGFSDRPPEYFDYNAISAKLNSQYKNFSQNSSRNNSAMDLPELEATASHASDHSDAASDKSQLNHDQLASQLEKINSKQSDSAHYYDQESPLRSSFAHAARTDSNTKPEKPDRHVHFNSEVRQCIAINDPSAESVNEYYGGYDDDDYGQGYGYASSDSYIYEPEDTDMHSLDSEDNDDDDDDDDDEEGGFFLKVPSSSGASHHPGLYKRDTDRSSDMSRSATSDSKQSLRRYSTIELLPSILLNYGSDDEDSDDENPYTSSLSHNVGNFSNRGYDYHYDYNTVYQVDPNHAIYGEGRKTPDVVDVPEDIALGSNFDYDIIENEDIRNFDQAPLDVINCAHDTTESSNTEKIPISSLDDSAAGAPHKPTPNPFSLNDSSDSDSDDEGPGLSINARNSSLSLAQLVFGGGMTSTDKPTDEANYPEHIQMSSEPLEKHVSLINPRYSSTGLLKQPHSSSSLSDQFFTGAGGLSKTESKSEEPSALSDMFFNPTPNNPSKQLEPDAADRSLKGGATLPPLQRKASPLPPHTTSENAFLGKASPPIVRQPPRSGFVLESESDSDSEIDDAVPPSEGARSPDSYSSLYKVADENGLKVSSPDSEEANNQRRGKGLSVASFLGGWNKNSN